MGWLGRLFARRERLDALQEQQRRRNLVVQLDELGFYRYVPASDAEALKQEYIQNGWMEIYGPFDNTRRIYTALYKEEPEPGWMEGVLLPLSRIVVWELAAELYPIQERLPGISTLRIGENIWSVEFPSGDEWALGMAERQLLLNAVNDLLQEKESEDRLFFMWGEKYESVYLLLTPAQRAAILQSGVFHDSIESVVPERLV